MNYNRENLKAFLIKKGYETLVPLTQDTSIRRYYRTEKNGVNAIVMESVPDTSPLMSRGHKMSDFIRIADWLKEQGLRPPEIYDADPEQGYMLLEDFGDISLKRAMENGENPRMLYSVAADILKQISAAKSMPDLPDYYQSRVHESRDCILKFYLPQKRDISEGQAQEISAAYYAAWDEVEKQLSPRKQSFSHIDFHAENLMWISGEKGEDRIGILDFQGAMIGHPAYDLANLLEDARQDVPPEIRTEILSKYDEDFRAHYRVLATQFHCRVIGQFIKIAEETGNKAYLKHIPRLENYIRDALHDPLLKPLKSFFYNLGLDF